MRLKEMICGVMLCGLLTAGAAGDELRHPAARKAMIRAEQETRKAEQAYRQELLRIQRALVSELERAKADAMQRQLLEDANAIQQAIDAAQAEVAKLEGKPVVQTFTIDARQSWQPTVEVKAGQRVEIRASGRWNGAMSMGDRATCGPDGMKHPTEGYHTYYLHGRINQGDPIILGSSATFTADVDGMLEMEMRDGSHDNNAGSIRVVVSVQ